MTNSQKQQAQFISPDAYPQMMSKPDAAQALKTLRSAQTKVKAQVVMESAVPPLKTVVLQYVAELEAGSSDMALVYDKVHDIRGFAENAGMTSTGRIAEVLCRYMDEIERIGRPADATIVALHVSAICRAAAAEEDDIRMGEIVTAQLTALVSRKLAEAQAEANKA